MDDKYFNPSIKSDVHPYNKLEIQNNGNLNFVYYNVVSENNVKSNCQKCSFWRQKADDFN